MKGLLAFTAVAAVISSIAAQTQHVDDDEISATAGVSSTSISPSTTTSSSPSSSTSVTTHKVKVGLDHRYDPDTITANVGDLIEFQFFSPNHSVVKADFRQPCIPYNVVNPGEDLFFSGPMLPTGTSSLFWTLEVNDTKPTYFYCSAPGSCIDQKMVGVINPDDEHTLAVQVEFITNHTTKFQISPGESLPAEGETPDSGDDDSGDGSSTSPSDGNDGSSGSGGLAPGAIAGIAIGGVAVVVFVVGLVYICGRKGGIEKGYRRSGRASQVPPPMVEAHYADDHDGGVGGVPSRYSSPLYDNMPKSPPPPSTYSSSYGGPPTGGMYPPDPYNNSHTSPHSSYIGPGGHPSPGYPPPQHHAFGSPPLGHHESLAPPPVELEAYTEPPRRELG